MAYLGRKGASAALNSADIPNDSITGAKIVDDAIDSEHYAAGSIDAAHVAADVATQAELEAQRTDSSITTLGTVTAGNLSNSAIVYPAGHVIQTVKNSYNSGDSLVTTTSTLKKVKSGSASYYWTGTITPSGASNDVLIKMGFSINVHKTSDTYAGGRVGINKDAQTPSSDTSGTDIFSTKDHGIYLHNNHASATFNNWMPIYIEFLDVAPGASRHDYYLTYSSYGTSNVTINSSSAYQPFQCILQEIQR